MATVINGILSRKLPWGLVLLGVSLVIAVELLGIRSLPFAVGAYLPIGTTLPIFVGGVVRWLVDQAAKTRGETQTPTAKSRRARSLPPGSSPPAASSAFSALRSKPMKPPSAKATFSTSRTPSSITIMSRVLAFAALAFSLYYFARKPLKK